MPSVLIIGAGFGGIGLGMLLRRAGINSFTILEKADSLGGTWRENRYPGAACDVPSHMYCYSFAPNPDWSRKWAPQHEILDYLTDCAERSGVMPHIRFGIEVHRAVWDPDSRQWVVTVADGRSIRSDVLVTAVGQLHHPAIPDIPGLDSFAGQCFHSARWPTGAARPGGAAGEPAADQPGGLELAGKRVAVVGTAASAVQIIPAIAPEVAHLSVLQRSPNWILRRGDRAYRQWEKRLFRSAPAAARAYRTWIWANYETRFPALRDRRVFVAMARRLLRRHMTEEIADSEMRERLTPDYPVGARRVLSADDYYPALARENVTLVTEPITRVRPDGVELADGRSIPLDVIVLATGFRSTEFLVPMQIIGRDGRRLEEDWAKGAQAYLGLSLPGYPNFFMLYGPNTNLGHNSILFMLECQARHIVACVRAMSHGDVIEVRRRVFDDFNTRLQADLQRTVWGRVDSSWYKNEAGRITNNWSSGTPRYWWLTRRSAPRAYDLTRYGG